MIHCFAVTAQCIPSTSPELYDDEQVAMQGCQPRLTVHRTSTTVDGMDSTLRTLVGGADAEDPYDALRAIAKLRTEINKVEAVTVRRARNRGASWQLIALALGVSRQAVHKKYGRR